MCTYIHKMCTYIHNITGTAVPGCSLIKKAVVARTHIRSTRYIHTRTYAAVKAVLAYTYTTSYIHIRSIQVYAVRVARLYIPKKIRRGTTAAAVVWIVFFNWSFLYRDELAHVRHAQHTHATKSENQYCCCKLLL